MAQELCSGPFARIEEEGWLHCIPCRIPVQIRYPNHLKSGSGAKTHDCPPYQLPIASLLSSTERLAVQAALF